LDPWLLCKKQKKLFCYSKIKIDFLPIVFALKGLFWHATLISSLPFVWLGLVITFLNLKIKESVGCMGYGSFVMLCNGCFSLHQFDLKTGRWGIAYRQCSMLKHYFIFWHFFVESRFYLFWNKMDPPFSNVKNT